MNDTPSHDARVRYDPELEEVRSWYVDGRRVHNPFASDAALVRRFDVWLSGVIREAKAEQREADARIAHMVHYAAECSTDGSLGPGMLSRSNAAREIAAAIRAGGTDEAAIDEAIELVRVGDIAGANARLNHMGVYLR